MMPGLQATCLVNQHLAGVPHHLAGVPHHLAGVAHPHTAAAACGQPGCCPAAPGTATPSPLPRKTPQAQIWNHPKISTTLYNVLRGDNFSEHPRYCFVTNSTSLCYLFTPQSICSRFSISFFVILLSRSEWMSLKVMNNIINKILSIYNFNIFIF